MIILKKLKIAILLSLLIVSFDNVVLSNAVGFEGKIHKNIYVRDIDISNLTREEAKNKINKIIESNNSFILNLSENKYVFLKEDIDVDYNVDDLIVVLNDNLLKVTDSKITLDNAFSLI